jgi:hypothetical protein
MSSVRNFLFGLLFPQVLVPGLSVHHSAGALDKEQTDKKADKYKCTVFYHENVLTFYNQAERIACGENYMD